MTKRIAGITILMSLVWSGLAQAVVVQDVGINYIGIYGHGRIFVSVDKPLPVPGCESAVWLQIESTHPYRKDYYSMLLSAHAAGKNININTTGCLAGQATIVPETGDYIMVK